MLPPVFQHLAVILAFSQMHYLTRSIEDEHRIGGPTGIAVEPAIEPFEAVQAARMWNKRVENVAVEKDQSTVRLQQPRFEVAPPNHECPSNKDHAWNANPRHLLQKASSQSHVHDRHRQLDRRRYSRGKRRFSCAVRTEQRDAQTR